MRNRYFKFQNPDFNILRKIAFWNKQKGLNEELILWRRWPCKRDSLFSGTAWKNGKSFIRKKISDYMEPSQPTLSIPSQPSKRAGLLPCNRNPGQLARQIKIFWACTYFS